MTIGLQLDEEQQQGAACGDSLGLECELAELGREGEAAERAHTAVEAAKWTSTASCC